MFDHSIVAVLWLCVLVGPGFVSGITVTSSRDIKTFLHLDVSDNLEEYIAYEQLRLRIISNDSRYEDEVPLVKQRIQEFKSIHKDLQKNKTANTALIQSAIGNHPTSVFASIRNFFVNWNEKFTNATAYGSRVREFMTRRHRVPLPQKADMYRAGAVIAFLRSVYNISNADIVKGQIKGHQGTPLSAADCYFIGMVSAQVKMVDDTIEWMRLALKNIDLSSPAQVKQEATFNVTDALVHLAKALITKEMKEEAVDLLEKATEIDPENMGVHNLYLANRFGRKVSRMKSVEVNPIRKQFFELCGNLSRGHSIGIRTNPPKRPRCRYRAAAETPYWRYKEEIINTYPFISTIHDFLGDKAIDSVLEVAHDKTFKEAPLPGGSAGQLWQSKIRSVSDFYHTAIRDVSLRVSYVTGLGIRQRKGSITLGEPIHVIDFGPGGTYTPHRDISKQYYRHYVKITDRGRLNTFSLFMSDTKEGGDLVFPELNITITPQKGMAVQVYNYKPSGDPETNLLVAFCPVLVGQSMILQKGIFTTGLDQNALCGRTPKSTYFSVEKAKGCNAGPCGAPNDYN